MSEKSDLPIDSAGSVEANGTSSSSHPPKRVDDSSLPAQLRVLAAQLNPTYRISSAVVEILANFTGILVETVLDAASIIATYGQVTQISPDELKVAVDIIFPKEILGIITPAADQALHRYTSPAKSSPKPSPKTDNANPMDVEINQVTTNEAPEQLPSAAELGLVLSPNQFNLMMRRCTSWPLSLTAPIYMAAVIEAMARDLWNLAGNETMDDGMVLVIDRHLGRAVDKHPAYRRFCNWIAPID